MNKKISPANRFMPELLFLIRNGMYIVLVILTGGFLVDITGKSARIISELITPIRLFSGRLSQIRMGLSSNWGGRLNL